MLVFGHRSLKKWTLAGDAFVAQRRCQGRSPSLAVDCKCRFRPFFRLQEYYCTAIGVQDTFEWIGRLRRVSSSQVDAGRTAVLYRIFVAQAFACFRAVMRDPLPYTRDLGRESVGSRRFPQLSCVPMVPCAMSLPYLRDSVVCQWSNTSSFRECPAYSQGM